MLLKTSTLLVLCTWLAGCGCGASHPGPDAATDSGRDSGRDAARDTGTDANRDARTDAARDARVDAGLDSNWLGCDPGWTPMPALDPDLTVYYATNPECLLPIAWQSCGVGCQRLVDNPRVERAIDNRWSDADRHLFTVVEANRRIPTVDAPVIVILASAEAEVFGAWRGSAPSDRTRIARVGFVGGGEGWTGFEMRAHRATPDGNFATYDERLYHAPLGALTRPLDPVLRLAPPIVSTSDIPQFVVASDTTWASEVQPRGQVLVVEHGVAHWLGGPGSATPANPQQRPRPEHRHPPVHGGRFHVCAVMRSSPARDDGRGLSLVVERNNQQQALGYAQGDLWLVSGRADGNRSRGTLIIWLHARMCG